MKRPTRFRRFLVKMKRLFVLSKIQTVEGLSDTTVLGNNMVNVLFQHYDVEEQTEILRAMQLQLIAKRKEQIAKTEERLSRLNADLAVNESYFLNPDEN